MDKLGHRWERKIFALIIVCFFFLILSCDSGNRKANVDNAVYIYIDSSQQVLAPEELVSIYEDRIAYEKAFRDSSIFIMGNIKSIDKEHGEVLLENTYVSTNVVCVVKDSVVLQSLKVSDKVLFKGICKTVGGEGLILIGQCELAQFKK
jgi:hypothetical protein